MRHAIALAEKGRLTASPNPMVGAVVVRNGKLISSGFHQKFGCSHAEPNALKKAGVKAKGATLYVTLEPCSTFGKTPPCAPLIKQYGIREVVIGALDPNPSHNGRGVQYLRSQGIRVVTGILSDEVARQNEGFFTLMTKKRPFVTLKMAQTLDGKIAAKTGLSRWISSDAAREFVLNLRGSQDAVLVGKNTFAKDNPELLAKKGSVARQAGKPYRVVLTSAKTFCAKAKIFNSSTTTILAFCKNELPDMVKKIDGIKNSPILLPVEVVNGKLDIKDLLEKLGDIGIARLLVEGGGELAWSFLNAKCVDRIYWIVAPKIFGGRKAITSVEGDGVISPEQALFVDIKNVRRLGKDWLFEGDID